jgi:hypothetical protein
VSAALFGDPAVTGRLTAGLFDPRVQTEVGDELLGPAEPAEVTHGSDDRQRHGGVHAGDGHQPLDLSTAKRHAAELSIDDPQLLGVKVQLAQQRVNGQLLVRRQRLVRKPAAALDPEQISRRAPRDQVTVKNRLHPILQAGPLTHDMRAASHLTTQRLCGLVGDPHRRQIVRGQQLRQHLGVNLVGLDLRLGDRAGLLRIGHHHPRHMRLEQPDDRLRVARRLDRDLILRPEAVGKDPQRLVAQRDPPRLADQAVLPHRDLRELSVHVQPDTPTSHQDLPSG